MELVTNSGKGLFFEAIRLGEETSNNPTSDTHDDDDDRGTTKIVLPTKMFGEWPEVQSDVQCHMIKRAYATEKCIGRDVEFSPTRYREEQEATEVEKLVGILQANLIIEEVVGEEKYCFSEGEGVAKGDDVGVNVELASDLAHVLFSEEDSFGEDQKSDIRSSVV